MIEPGVYRLNYRGSTLSECRRFGKGPAGFLVLLVWRACGKRGEWIRLPDPAVGRICREDELTTECREHLAQATLGAAELGYRTVAFVRPPQVRPRTLDDGGALWALHEDGRRFLNAAYTHVHAGTMPTVTAKRVAAACGVLSPDLHTTTVGSGGSGFDDPGWLRAVRLPKASLAVLHRRLTEELQAMSGPILSYASVDEFLRASARQEEGRYERLIQRGLYVRVSAEEERRLLQESGVDGADTMGP